LFTIIGQRTRDDEKNDVTSEKLHFYFLGK